NSAVLSSQQSLLAFEDARRSSYVCLVCTLRLDDQTSPVRALWTGPGSAYFDGPEDPDIVALAFDVTGGRWWDGPDSRIGQSLALARAIVTHDPSKVGEVGPVVTGPPPDDAPRCTTGPGNVPGPAGSEPYDGAFHRRGRESDVAGAPRRAAARRPRRATSDRPGAAAGPARGRHAPEPPRCPARDLDRRRRRHRGAVRGRADGAHRTGNVPVG